MTLKHTFMGWLCLIFLAPAAQGQPAPPLPVFGPAALLYVRFEGPSGLRVTFYQGMTRGRQFQTPASAGLRPGYIHRVELTNLPNHPGVALFPTLEVIGTLVLPPGQRAADYPV